MESSTYWLDLIAETYIGICVLCCLFIISKQRRRPAQMCIRDRQKAYEKAKK